MYVYGTYTRHKVHAAHAAAHGALADTQAAAPDSTPTHRCRTPASSAASTYRRCTVVTLQPQPSHLAHLSHSAI